MNLLLNTASTTSNQQMDPAAMAAILILAAVVVAFVIFEIIAMVRIFQKAGRHGFLAIIPFVNIWTYFAIAWGHGAKMFLTLIPVYGIIVAIKTEIRIARSFGKSVGFALGLIFLAPIFYLILGFSKNAVYRKI